ncbi:bacillithiol biosynthesis deacetylase BshB1 [Rapidithrix thailandica]|uniref:Bacillithiol biosynthesis deacetylase BshB1 n=1 Tax=Rapidithrix thailandica TaxID=413964 RepID=A0AAW9S6H6_9BACT
MKLDILVLAAHPDDAELSCSGTLLAHIALGKKVGIIDFTQGEMGTRGSAEIRKQEAEASSKILGVHIRENLQFADAFFKNDREHQLEVIKVIRKYRPEIVLANAPQDRHPDHPKAAALSVEACFYSGLKKLSTQLNGQAQEAWRPKKVYHFIQSDYIEPDFSVDITPYWDKKVESIKAFATQFHTGSAEDKTAQDSTFISTPEFMHFIESRARHWAKPLGVKYAEGFVKTQPIGVKDLFDLL